MTTSWEIRGTVASYPTGQHLQCDNCGAEVVILKPCSSQPPDQVLRCCDRDMRPATPVAQPEPELVTV